MLKASGADVGYVFLQTKVCRDDNSKHFDMLTLMNNVCSELKRWKTAVTQRERLLRTSQEGLTLIPMFNFSRFADIQWLMSVKHC